jgi:hypothetical protein
MPHRADVLGQRLTTPGASMTHADAEITGPSCGCPHSLRSTPAGSVAVLLNQETTPSQLHITPVSTVGTLGPGKTSYLVILAYGDS